MLFPEVIMQLLLALTRAVIPMLCVAHIVIAMFVRRAIIGVFDHGFVMPLGGVGCLEDKGENGLKLIS
jgi:hypothetical protein